jgi:hypothetical protein
MNSGEEKGKRLVLRYGMMVSNSQIGMDFSLLLNGYHNPQIRH